MFLKDLMGLLLRHKTNQPRMHSEWRMVLGPEFIVPIDLHRGVIIMDHIGRFSFGHLHVKSYLILSTAYVGSILNTNFQMNKSRPGGDVA